MESIKNKYISGERMKKNYSLFLIIVIFFITLTTVRLIWNSTFQTVPEQPFPSHGELDLSHVQLPNKQSIVLDGEWEFYPDVLLTPNEIEDRESTNKNFGKFPKDWITYSQTSTYNKGTFRLQVLVDPKDALQTYGLQVFDLPTASKVFVNGKELAASGNPADRYEDYLAQKIPFTVFFDADHGKIDILIHVANGEYPISAKNINSIKFGYESALHKEILFSIALQIVALTIFLTLAVYTIFIYLIGTKSKVLIYFFLLSLSATVMFLQEYDNRLLSFLSLQYEHSVKIAYLTLACIALFLLLFFKHLLPDYSKRRVFTWFPYACLSYMFFIIVFPAKYALEYRIFLSLTLLIPAITITIQFWKATLASIEGLIYLLLGAVAVSNNIVWAIMGNRTSFQLGFYPWDLIIAIFLFSAFWFKQYFRNAEQNEKLSKELIKADKHKDEFLANTSHELRNPLHSMVNIAHTLLENEQNKLEEKDRQNLNLLITVGRRMSLMINDLLDLALLKENNIRLKRTPVKLQSVTAGVVDMLYYMTDGKPVRLVNDIPNTFPLVMADENKLIQIVLNLLHNAIKYTDEGEIVLTATIDGNHAFIHIKDTGVGMSNEVRDSIFQPYEQGEEKDKVIRGGVGLGLTICKQLVELHGGQLNVESVLGYGSIFTFSIPLANQAEEMMVRDSITEPHLQQALAFEQLSTTIEAATLASGKPKILLVDDEPLNLHVLTNILSSQHYQISTTTSGKDALIRIHNEQWDLVISDVMMPYMSGYELTKKIRERYDMSELPILLLTARSRPEDLNIGFLSGANDYISKPVDPLELRARVRVLTDLKRSITEHLQMEAAWLHAQIKPHFFFNTLNSIMILFDHDPQKAKSVFEAFCYYLQTTFEFQSSNHVIKLEDELELVRSYILIEKERFRNRLQIIWEIDNELDSFVPPLSIQTLVENAINHGVLKRYTGGTITIRIVSSGDDITIVIKDNGVGMDETQFANLLERKNDKTSGIGLYNTDRRLKQLYGKGLDIESNVEQGTTISFHIPIRQQWDS